MKGWRDRILGAAMMLILVGAIALYYTSPRTGERFTGEDYRRLALVYPGGRYIPEVYPSYYRVCLNNVWHRFYPDGSWWDRGQRCWK